MTALCYYTVTEFAQKMRLHPASLRRLIRQRKVEAVRFGGRWLIPVGSQ